MQETKHKKTKVFLLVVIFLLSVGLLELCSLLIQQNRYVNHLDNILSTKSKLLFTVFQNKKGPATINDVVLIQNWMTFDYINHIFALPTDYLQTSLHITDTRYPRLTVTEYAEDIRVRSSEVLTELQGAVRLYFTKING